jgi:hypothetical protein
MKVTFGIITFPHPDNLRRINEIINSIEQNNIPDDNYEIIVVGGDNPNRKNTTHVKFNEGVKKNWITRKKNVITLLAKFDNIVYSHDYIKYDPKWYEGFVKFGDNFDVISNPLIGTDNLRFRDWIIAPVRCKKLNEYLTSKLEESGREALIPYDIQHLSHFMIIGGYYWVAKKHIMLEFPLEEKLIWGDGEDFRWCHALQKKYKVAFNEHSKCYLMKEKGRYFVEVNPKTVEELRNLRIPESELIHDYQHYEFYPLLDIERGQGLL